jgi:glutaminase
MKEEFKKTITSLYKKYSSELSGDVSNAFPALSMVDPDLFAISAYGINGDHFHIGDFEETFTIQSISKPFSYALALEQKGLNFVESKVGVEPTGEDFDTIIKIDDQNRPFNPMVNSGAIATTGLIAPDSQNTVEEELLTFLSNFAGRELSIDPQVYQSERNHGHKNWAIAHLLRHFKVLPKDFKEALDLYFKQCSVRVNCDDLAVMAATLANNGVNPLTKTECISPDNLRNVLSILFTCGMYNYSGEWAFDVGLPAKSGICGGIILVIPGVMGVAIYSPRLDKRGNSIRGLKLSEELSNIFNLHIFAKTLKKSIL